MEQVFSVIGNVAVAAVNDVLNYPVPIHYWIIKVSITHY